ncbi:MAG: DUF624 domain-containing protein [Clostridiales bacterium]|nr:DUF624 domain-containing protein [Clostridiales bacterium]
MAGLFNSFYYGKAGKADYTPENLPANRVQLFFETLRVRFSGLVGMNLLYAIFALPAIAWTGFNLAAMNVEGADALSFIPVYLLGMIPCLMITALATPGFAYVFRNWARDQHAFTMSDFKDAVKGNWKPALLTGAINGVSLYLTYVSYVFYGSLSAQSLFWVVPQMFVIIACSLWWMANMLIFPMMVTYDMKLKQLVRNSFIITLARLPWSILFWAAPIAVPVAIVFLPYSVVILAVLYLVIGFSLTMYAQVSYANACFDRFLNPRIEGAPVNLGLRDPDYDEDDEDETPPES